LAPCAFHVYLLEGKAHGANPQKVMGKSGSSSEQVINKLFISGSQVVYDFDANEGWTMDIDKIVFIGEYTTANGPYVDDYFIVFAESKDEWWQASFYAIDHNSFWDELGKRLNCELVPSLTGSVVWASKVIYPAKFAGQNLFDIAKVEGKSLNLFQKLLGADDESEKIQLSADVKNLFE
jgi:hypothetical protein